MLWRTEVVDLRTLPGGEPILDEGYSLMEIKAAGAMPLWLAKLINENLVRQTSFSKYGMAYMTMLKNEMCTRRDVINV